VDTCSSVFIGCGGDNEISKLRGATKALIIHVATLIFLPSKLSLLQITNLLAFDFVSNQFEFEVRSVDSNIDNIKS
jgi:hypothetical protein